MMGIWDSILFGILQGVTEFLPVSSSGHLAVAQKFFGYNAESHLLFDVVLHVGTLLTVVWVYRASLGSYVTGSIGVLRDDGEGGTLLERCQKSRAVREIFWIGLATVPTGIIGILFQKQLKAAFGSLSTIAIMFSLTACLLLITLWRSSGDRDIANLGWQRALIIGLAQGIAIMPGISRSGTTIAVALLLGMRRDEAARFSFLLAIPAISGAALLEIRKVDSLNVSWMPFVAGGLAAMVVGYIALRFLIHLVQKGQLAWFAAYLWCLSAAILLKLYVFAG